MTLQDRCDAYARSPEGMRFPDSVPRVSPSGRWLEATWIMGNDYRAPSRLYGAYPPRYLKRMLALFPDVRPARTLHLFAGCVPEAPGPDAPHVSMRDERWVRVDRSFDRDPRPTAYADAMALPLVCGSMALTLADPPYTDADAERYGTPMPNRKTAVHEAARVTAPRGFLVWLDTTLPMYRKREWRHVGNVTVIRSTNHRYRVAAIFERQAA